MKVTLAQAGIVAGILTLSWVVGGPKEILSAPPTGNHPHQVFNSTSKAHAEKVASLVPDSIVKRSGDWVVMSKTPYDEARSYFQPWLRENDYFRTNQFLSEVKYEAEYSRQYQHELWREGDMRIVADYDEDFWNHDVEGWFEDEEEYEQFRKQVKEHGVYVLALEKQVQGEWEWVDSVRGNVPNENLTLMDIAKEQFEFKEAESFAAEGEHSWWSANDYLDGKWYICSNCGAEKAGGRKRKPNKAGCEGRKKSAESFSAETFKGIPKSVSDLESLEDVRADKYEMEVNFENEDIVIISGGELKAIIDDGWYLDSVRSFADAGMSLLFTRNPYHAFKAEIDGEESFSADEDWEAAEDEDTTTCEDCGVKIGYDEAIDWEGLDRCEDCYDYWMMKDRQNYTGDETDCISCGYSISPNDVRFELVEGLCPDCKADGSFHAEETEDLAEVRTDLSQKRTNMSALRTALSVAGLFLVWDSWRWGKEERKLKGL